MLNKLNKTAEKTFHKLIDGLKVHESRKIENSTAFMAVHIEVLEQRHKSLVVSVAHYFEQNGDLCCDPDMTFLVNDLGVFPLTFQQAIPPVYQVAAEFTENGGMRYNKQLQKQLTQFANGWMKNIEAQQF
ncbi:MAG: hypothetical protein R3C18_27990 [Planctomycetaceae bacterium]